VHVLTELASECDKNGAIPRNMTGLAEVLKRAGYATHQVGKWDCGMATPYHTPKGRGYDTSLGYFSHGNWMYSEAEWLGSYDHLADVPEPGFIDFWDTDRPARHLNGTGYEEYIFRDRIQSILRAHDRSKPLFLQYDSKVAHYPMQAPIEYQERFKHIEDDNRRMYSAMVNFLDDQLANITETMKELGMWENTLMVLTSDNGGYVKSPLGGCNTTHSTSPSAGSDVGHGTACFNGEAGANNYPLRGGKYSLYEGGIRVNAFMSGGYLPPAVRGTRQQGAVHIADWYRTLSEGIAGLDPVDYRAAQSGLPPIDSLNKWPMLSGQNLTSPRETAGWLVTGSALLMGRWKYVKGGAMMSEAAQGGPHYPNASTALDPIENHKFKCPKQGCLFDVVADPTEASEISQQHPEIVDQLHAELVKQAATMWAADHAEDPRCRQAASSLHGGFLGPWEEVDAWEVLRSSGRRNEQRIFV
jgi:arylsulfatase I/J